jgi:iron-sulfur cluster assembly protein
MVVAIWITNASAPDDHAVVEEVAFAFLGRFELIKEVSELAKIKAVDLAELGEFLRIAITGGGCNGLSYKMKFVPAPKRGDILVRTANTQVVVDPKTALYLKGTHLDYSGAMVAGGFKFSNPNAKASCSCGESFSV